MTTISAPEPSKKRAIKRKLDDSILKKARAALGLPLEAQDDDDGEKQNGEPSLKWRKPRHNTAEGQLYMKNKEKRRQEEEEETRFTKSSSNSHKKEDKKRKKKNKKKKKTDESRNAAPAEKNPESEKRHEMEAVSYLQLWAANRDHWKFEKRKQTWLLKHCLNEKLIDEKRFEILLEYIASVKGAARQATYNEMQSIVKRKEMLGDDDSKKLSSEGTTGTEESSVHTSVSEISNVMYERARQIIQMLVD